MNRIRKKLKAGIHVLALPIAKPMPLEALFPKEIAGSTIETLDSDGSWINEETVLYENNTFKVSDVYARLKPLQVVKMELKRDISINWEVDFRSHSHLKDLTINFELGFDFDEALYLAQLSQLVYEDEKSIKKVIAKQYDFEEFYYYSRQSHKNLLKKGLLKLFMIFFRGRKSIIDLQFMHLNKIDEKSGKNLVVVVFQGSQEPEDWMTNFSFDDDDFHAKGRVHKGFHHAMKLFFQTIKKKNFRLSKRLPLEFTKDIDKVNENTRIMLAGHSLGGALATLVGCYLYEIGIKPENLEVYTFGAPPVGTEEFCAHYEKKFNIFRLVNENDVVPKIDKITKFFHLGEEIVLPSNEGEVHSCEGYIDNIIDVMESAKVEDR
jgi:hypothetical protein